MGRVGKKTTTKFAQGKKIEKEILARRKIQKKYSCTGENKFIHKRVDRKKIMQDENSPHPPSLF